MRIGVGITLITVGAIIAFAVRDTSETFNLTALGVCIMLAGAAGMWVSYRMTNTRHTETGAPIDPAVEKQYSITPPERVADEAVDVTPSHLRETHPDQREPS